MPWSKLKPRRKYWLALPDPLCWVAIMPGTVSINSPTRDKGRYWNSGWPTSPCDAEYSIPIKSLARPSTSTVSIVVTGSSSSDDVFFAGPDDGFGAIGVNAVELRVTSSFRPITPEPRLQGCSGFEPSMESGLLTSSMRFGLRPSLRASKSVPDGFVRRSMPE